METIAINELFLKHEVEDSVLRMIFAACNPLLNAKEQIAFSLKIISGFSGKEIAKALLLKEETIKKRLLRARKVIQTDNIAFEIPNDIALTKRLNRVLEVIYLIFNEGFHSNRKDLFIREELCGEAMRLSKILLSNSLTATADSYALFALFCFQSSRLESKIDVNGDIMSIDKQDRSTWFEPLISLGHLNMEKAVESGDYGQYHYESAIAAEHIQATTYSETNWHQILHWYTQLYRIDHTTINALNIAVVQLQLKNFEAVKYQLDHINSADLEQKMYLYMGTYAAYYHEIGASKKAIEYIEQAIKLVENQFELKFLQEKKKIYESQ